MALLSMQDIHLNLGGKTLLENANLSIEAGDRVCLAGRNGAGKSSLLALLGGQIQPDSGLVVRSGPLFGQMPQAVPESWQGTVFDLVAAVLGNRGQANYAAAKAALHGASKSLAREMGSRGITVNVVAPGVIAGSMTREVFAPEHIKTMVPAARAGSPQEVAALVAFLCGEDAGYINGQVIGIDGGMS